MSAPAEKLKPPAPAPPPPEPTRRPAQRPRRRRSRPRRRRRRQHRPGRRVDRPGDLAAGSPAAATHDRRASVRQGLSGVRARSRAGRAARSIACRSAATPTRTTPSRPPAGSRRTSSSSRSSGHASRCWILALALLSGALLALSFPKFGHPAIAWIALAPLLVALAHRPQCTWRRALLPRARDRRRLLLPARSTGWSRR